MEKLNHGIQEYMCPKNALYGAHIRVWLLEATISQWEEYSAVCLLCCVFVQVEAKLKILEVLLEISSVVVEEDWTPSRVYLELLII